MIFETQDLNVWILDILEITRTPTAFSSENVPYDFFSCRISGKGHFKCNGKVIPYNPGEFIICPKNIKYSQCCETDEHLIVIHSKMGGYWPKEIEVAKLHDPYGMINTLKKCTKFGKASYPDTATDAIRFFYKQIAYETTMLHYADTPEMTKIKPSIEYIHQNFSRPELTIHEIAKQSLISDVYFSKLFYRAYKMPTVKYLTDIRINHAKSLISSDAYTFEQIAALCGFKNYKYFYEVFRRITGKSPSEYKKESPLIIDE